MSPHYPGERYLASFLPLSEMSCSVSLDQYKQTGTKNVRLEIFLAPWVCSQSGATLVEPSRHAHKKR